MKHNKSVKFLATFKCKVLKIFWRRFWLDVFLA